MGDSLTIDRLRVVGAIPDVPGQVQRHRAALAALDAPRLSAALRRALPAGGGSDARVIVLRRVEITLDAAGLADPDRIAARLAEGIAAMIARLALSTPQSAGIVAFASPADRLARYLRARAAGEPCDVWWFADIAVPAVLPLSSALRVALLRDTDTGLAALAMLTAGDRARVLGRLGGIDTALVLQALRDLPAAADEPDREALTVLGSAPLSLTPAQGAIHLLADLAAMTREPPRGDLLPILHLRVLAERAQAPDRLAAAIAAGATGTLVALLPEARPEMLAALLRLTPPARIGLARSVAALPRSGPRTGFTPFGGILILLPHLPPFDDAALPDTVGDPQGTVALLALAALWGPRDGAPALADPVLREIFAIDPRIGLEALAAWLREARLPEAPPAADRTGAGLPEPLARQRRKCAALVAAGLAAAATFAHKLPGCTGSSLAYLRTNLLDVGARVTAGSETIRAVLERPPLDVLLGISGLADRSTRLPDGRTLVLERVR